MTELSPITAPPDAGPYRLTQRDYMLLAENGAFDKHTKVELIEGVILAVNAQYSRHARVQTLLFRALASACDRLEGDLQAWIEVSVSAGEGNMPQPDILLAAQLPGEGPVPADTRIMALDADKRVSIAQYRVEKISELLRASGCAVTSDPPGFAINFHTGRHLMVIQIDPFDPRKIKLMMAFVQPQGDITKARWACFEATSKQFASKATADARGTGISIVLSVGVYAEALHAFGDSLKAYVEDVELLYEEWVNLMISE